MSVGLSTSLNCHGFKRVAWLGALATVVAVAVPLVALSVAPVEAQGATGAAVNGWQQYGGNARNSQVDGFGSPLRAANVGQLKEAWRVLVEDGASSTPVVADGVVYFGSWSGHVYAVDLRDGTLIWQQRAGRSFVRDTPLISGDRLFVGADGSLVCLSRATGELLFSTVLSDHPDTMIDASPKLVDGMVIIGTASFEPHIVKDDYTFEGAVLAVDAMSGEILWRVPTTGPGYGPCEGAAGAAVWSTAAVDTQRGLLYVGTGNSYETPASTCNDTLLSIHYQRDYSGASRIAWKQTFTEDDVFISVNPVGRDYDIGAGPNLFEVDGAALVGVGDKSGTYRAFNRQSGEELWRTTLDRGTTAGFGGVMTTAAVYDGVIYVASNRWSRYGFDASGTHHPADTATLYALQASDGAIKWSQPLPRPVFGTFALVGDLLLHPLIDGTLSARRLDTGEVVWQTDVGLDMGSGPSVAGAYVLTSAGVVTGGNRPREGAVVAYALAQSGDARVIDGRAAPEPPLSGEACQTALAGRFSDACNACLCACDATAAGRCETSCWERVSCLAQSCPSQVAEDQETEALIGWWLGNVAAEFDEAAAYGRCYEEACVTKLLPTSVFDSSVEAGPCGLRCVAECGF